MKGKLLFTAILVMLYAAMALPTAVFADTPSPAAATNNAVVDVTLTDAGYMTVGGVDLKALGVAPLDAQVMQIVKTLDTARVVVAAETVTVDVHGNPAVKMQWNPASRAVLVDLAGKYGVVISPAVMNRVEEWITSSNVDVTARFTNQPSKAASISLTKPVWIDIASNGAVAVENGPLAYGIEQSVLAQIRQSGVQNALVCWNKGTLKLTADGKALPSITLDPKGAAFLAKAFNLMVSDVTPFFDATLGADVSMGGAKHTAGANCGQ